MPQKLSTVSKRIAFLGAGNMAEALIGGMIAGGVVAKRDIIASDIRPERRAYLSKKFGVSAARSAAEAVRKSAIIFLSVKPQQMEGLLREIGPAVTPKHLVISIAAGVTTRYIERLLRPGVAVVRSMPNTPALVRAGAVGVCRGKAASQNDIRLALKLFSTVGVAAEFPERRINAVTAVSGSGPAYIFYVAEALEKAARKLGLPNALAASFARQTVAGAGIMLAQTGEPAEALRKRVTSPGGTTEAAITFLQEKNFFDIFERAVRRAEKRARELAK